MRRLSVGAKVAMLVILALLLVLLAGMAGIFEVQRLSRHVAEISLSAQANQYTNSLRFDLEVLKRVLAEGTARKNLEWFRQPLDQPLARISTNSERLHELLQAQGDTVPASELRANTAALTEQVAALVQLAVDDEWNTAYLNLANLVEPAAIVMGTQIQALDEELQQRVAAATAVAEETRHSVLRNLVVITLGAVLLLGLGGWRLWGNLVKPLRALTITATTLAEGDLDVRAPTYHRADEVGGLSAAFNTMADTIQASHQSLAHQVEERTAELQAERTALQQTLTELRTSTIEREELLETLQHLQNPVVPITEGVVVVPIVGQLTSQRAQQLQATLLEAVIAQHVRIVILDVTGIPVLDNHAAQSLIQTSSALRLLGTKTVVVGIRPEVAQSLVSLGVDSTQLMTTINLQHGLDLALRMLRRQIITVEDTRVVSGLNM